MDTVYITQPWLLIFAAAVIALHAVTYFVPKIRLPLTAVNVLVHTAAAAAIIIAGGEIEEFVLLLLISSFASLLIGHLEHKKENKEAPAEGTEPGQKEENKK